MRLVPPALHIPVAFTKLLHPTPAGLESSTAFAKHLLGTILLRFFKRFGQEAGNAQFLAVMFTGFHCLLCASESTRRKQAERKIVNMEIKWEDIWFKFRFWNKVCVKSSPFGLFWLFPEMNSIPAIYQFITSASTIPAVLVRECADKLEGTSFVSCPTLLCGTVMHGKPFFQPRPRAAALQDGWRDAMCLYHLLT